MISLALLVLAAAPLQDPKPNEVYASWTFRPEEVKDCLLYTSPSPRDA